jgi:ABC-type multidrug transport system fused ATPase/permease subunit
MSDTHISDSLKYGLRRLYGQVSPARKRQLYMVFVLMLLSAFAELVTLGAILPFLVLLADPGKAASYPLLQKAFVVLGWSDPHHILLPATLLFGSIALGAGAVRLLLIWMSQRFIFQLGHDLGVEVYRRTLYQPYLYHVSKNTSEVIATVNKVDAVVVNFLMQILQIFIAVAISTFIVAALVAINPIVALTAAIGFGLIYLAVSYATRLRVRANSKAWAGAQGRRIKALQEGLGGIRDVLIDQCQASFISRYASVDLTIRRAQASNLFVTAAPRFVIEACGMVLIAGMALVLSQGPGGLITALPVLGALALGAQRLLPLLQLIYSGWTSMNTSRQSLADVVAILDLPIEGRYQSTEPIEPLPFERKIELEGVSFRYGPDRPLVLKDVSLTVNKGARVGFIGKTGSGKSTIMDLVMGLLQPTSGQIKIDGTVLTLENVREWQAQIAHVPQAIYLSDTTIAANIAFGVAESEIDLVRVQEAARHAELEDFIESLSDQYNSIVGERGIRLSGGQRQRIGIARALYKQAKLLVFDEATSALDNETEAAVMASIGSLHRDLTILIIAHRLSTVEKCDQIYRLDGGRLVGRGLPYTVIVDRVASNS